MGAAEKLPELGTELRDAIGPKCSREQLQALLALLEKICAGEVQVLPRQTAGSHRKNLAAATDILRDLSYVGRVMVASAHDHLDLAKAVEDALPRAQRRVRVLRTVHAMLVDESEVDADADILAEAEAVMRARREFAASELSASELEELADERMADPERLASWLDAP